MLTLVLSAVSLVAQAEPPRAPTSRPTAAATRPGSDRDRIQRHVWGEDAPGSDAVGGYRFLPIVGAPYTDADGAAARVRGHDLVIGLTVGEQAWAYPINMLGGPTREIVNEVHEGVRFCVNW